ncbi:penicillin-binding protein [Streptosporangiaceae bacterium NEAU-GS5]|nr:penicillin-binding protein [Streptosporangiaceae bacterium NEAU-GS5]
MKLVRLALALGLAAPALTACFEEPSPHEAVREFLVGWEDGDYASAARRADGDPATVRKALEAVGVQLDAASMRFSVSSIKADGDQATAKYHAEVDLGENNPLWEYDSVLPLHLVGGEWKVRWSPAVIHPDMHEGQRLAVAVDPQPRQPILDRDGNPLQTDARLYVASVIPSELSDPAELCRQLSAVTGFAQDRLLSKILSAPPNDRVPLATFGRAKYEELRARLAAIQGLRVFTDTQPVAPASPTQIVGRVAAITAEKEQQLGGPQRAGDTVGREGLQKAYQDQLTGSTETRVIIIDTKTQEMRELKSWPGRKNTSVKTTIDSRLQRAADIATTGQVPAALVAVQASTGQILAVSTDPGHRFNQEKDALAGHYPPGTTYSIVTSYGLLKNGFDVRRKVPCTADRTVGGARFTAEVAGTTTGTVGASGAVDPTGKTTSAVPDDSATFAADFAQGCATALASLARLTTDQTVDDSSATLGVAAKWGLPVSAYSGALPAGSSDADRARIIAGTTVRVSPLSMALVAGAVASGTWRPPVLVTSPATPDPAAEATLPSAPSPIPLDQGAAAKLRDLMRAGVTSGSAQAAAAPGDPVYGVAAGLGYTEKKRRNLSWFVGWQGDVAIAVMAETPDQGEAAVIAGTFFRNAHVTP